MTILETHGIEVLAFIDNSEDKQKKTIYNLADGL